MLSYIYSAFTKLMFIILLLALWDAEIIPNGSGGTTSLSVLATQIKLGGQWLFAKQLYPFIDYDTLLTMQQFALFLVGFKLVMWIFAPGTSNMHGGNGNLDAGNSGFSTDKING